METWLSSTGWSNHGLTFSNPSLRSEKRNGNASFSDEPRVSEPRLSNSQWEGLRAGLNLLPKCHGLSTPSSEAVCCSPAWAPPPHSHFLHRGPGWQVRQSPPPARPLSLTLDVLRNSWRQKDDFPSSERSTPLEGALPGAWGTLDLDVRGSSVQVNFQEQQARDHEGPWELGETRIRVS